MHYSRNPNVAWEEVDNGITLTGEDGSIYYMDEIGAALWRLLDRPSAMPDVVEVFGKAFPDVPHDRLRNDLEPFLEEMVGARLAVAEPHAEQRELKRATAAW